MRTPARLLASAFLLGCALVGLAAPARADWNDGRHNRDGWRYDRQDWRGHQDRDWRYQRRHGHDWGGNGNRWSGRIIISPGWPQPYGRPYPAPVYVPAPIYVPRPVYVPSPVYVRPPAPQPYCREYQGDAIINGSGQPFYGTACLQPDGSWKIVN